MADDRIEIEIVLDDGSIQKGFANVKRQSGKDGKKAGDNFAKGFARGLSALSRVAVGATAAVAAAFGAGRIVQAAARQEEAINNLNVALTLAGDSAQLLSQDIQDFASEIERTTRVGDETALELFALARAFATSSEQARDLVSAAIDLNAATGISLESAVRNLGKTLSGLTGELGEAVPQVRNLTAEQLKAGEAIKVIADRFQGAAVGQVSTFAGSIDRLSNSFGTLLENLGSLVTGSPAVVNAINNLATIFNKASEFIGFQGAKQGAERLDELRIKNRELTAQIIKFEDRIADLNKRIAESRNGSEVYGSSLAILKNQLAGLNEESQKTVEQIRKISAELSAAQQGRDAGAGDAGLAGRVEETIKAGTEALKQTPLGNLAFLEQTFQERLLILQAGLENELLTQQQFELTKNALTEQFETQRLALLKKSGDKETLLAERTSKAVGNALNQGIGQGVAAFGAALAKGENAFEAFGKSVLGILGDLLINIGTGIVTASKAIEALRAALTTLFGGNALLAGLALIALGGALKAISGAGGLGNVSAGGAAGGGVGALPPAPVEEPSIVTGDEELGRQTAVTVNVDGTVLDPRSVGLQIAEVLQETFDTSDNVVVSA